MQRDDYTKEILINIIKDLKQRNLEFDLQAKVFGFSKKNKLIYKQVNSQYPNAFINVSELHKALNCDVDELFCKNCGKRVTFISEKRVRQFCSVSCKSQYMLKVGKVVNPSLRPECVAKRNKTFVDKFGCNPSQLLEIKKKKEATCFKHFGVKFPGQVESGKLKSKQTCLEKYGVEHYNQSEIAKEKQRQFNLLKFGVENMNQVHIKNYNNLHEDYVRNNFIKDNKFLIQEFQAYFNLQYKAASQYKKQFNIQEQNKLDVQKTQQELYRFIKSLNISKVNYNDRNALDGKELDIYIPDKKLAIEFDGLMFHSFGKSKHVIFNNFIEEDRNIHLFKTMACQEKGIQLLHIFENEWLTKKDIWKSVIKNKLGLVTNKIYARKCEIRQVQNLEKETFLNTNHLQGSCQSSINLGLYYNNELVSLMTFGKSRFNKKYKYELLRFCNKLDTVIVGAASKLLNYFRKHYNGSIISYANRRWSNGDLYKKLGFSFVEISEPNYFYFNLKDRILISRIQFQKHKLQKKLSIFNPDLSETQNMYNNGYRKIYDCGNYTFSL